MPTEIDLTTRVELPYLAGDFTEAETFRRLSEASSQRPTEADAPLGRNGHGWCSIAGNLRACAR